MRKTLITTALILAIAAVCAQAQEGGRPSGSLESRPLDNRLPDIGSSAGEVIGPAEQAEYGSMLLSQLRHYGYVLDDPLIDGWLQSLGARLAAASDKPEHPFTFFMLKDRQFNAFATLGGYVGTNAGLVLAAESEDEVAGVLSHEVAHVTQLHVLRSIERAQKDSVPILLAMLGAVALASQSDSTSSGDAGMAAIASGLGLMHQRQIDYTRSNEAEADRLGIRTLSRSGYDPVAMAAMFTRMQTVSRVNQSGERERAPDYLRTHPVTTTRISEAKERAEAMAAQRPAFRAKGAATDNPLFPSSLSIEAAVAGHSDPTAFGWARERIRVFSANTPEDAIREYERERRGGRLSDAQRYGLAVARLRNGQYNTAAKELEPLLTSRPTDPWLVLGMAEAEARAGNYTAADARLEALLRRLPRHRAAALTYAALLGERNTAQAGHRAQALLRPMLTDAKDDPVFQQTFARVSEIAGDPVRAGEAYAEAEYLNGRPERALVQLNTLLKRNDLDYYARARIDARIAAITPTVLELRRQGVRDEVLDRR